jgi:hypothetical protein
VIVEKDARQFLQRLLKHDAGRQWLCALEANEPGSGPDRRMLSCDGPGARASAFDATSGYPFEVHIAGELARIFFPTAVLFCAPISGCSTSTIEAHEVDVVLDYRGTVTRAIVGFPERDPEAMHSSSGNCTSFLGGGCGFDQPTVGTVLSGDAPIERATLTTVRSGEGLTYDVYVRTAEADVKNGVDQPLLCRVYDTEMSSVKKCLDALAPMKPITIRIDRR